MTYLVSKTTLLRRIEKAWNHVTEANLMEGRLWYENARAIAHRLADSYGVLPEAAIAVIAATSPRIRWGRNLTIAEVILAGGIPTGVFSRSIENAQRALDSDNPIGTLSGNKVQAFAANISGNLERVTIDKWMLESIGLEQSVLNNVGHYERIEGAFRQFAHRLAIAPAHLQAAIWISMRGKSEFNGSAVFVTREAAVTLYEALGEWLYGNLDEFDAEAIARSKTPEGKLEAIQRILEA